MKVALTGGAGLLGRHLLAWLSRRDIPVARIDRSDWDLQDAITHDRLDQLAQGADVFVHCAARIDLAGPADDGSAWQALFDSNVRATLNAARWAADRDVHFIFVSSGSVYRDPHARGIDESAETAPGPLGGDYATTKRLAEAGLAELAQTSGARVTVLRPSALYGHGLPDDKFLVRMLNDAAAGQNITVTGPKNSIDFVNAHDLSRAILQSSQAKAYGVFNISGGGPVSLADLAQEVMSVAGGRGVIETRPGDSPPFTRFDLSSDAARAAFGYAPVVDIATGLEMTLRGQLLPGAA